MSLDTVKTIVVDGVRWYRATEVAKILGYASPRNAIIDHVDKRNKKKCQDLVELDKHCHYSERVALFINDDGLNSLVLTSRMPKSIDVATEMGIKSEMKYLRKEIEIVSFIQSFLTGLKIPFEFQKTVAKYRIDLYLPLQQLAIEIDENDHKYRNQQYENEREDTIKQSLQCQFIRINPDDHKFNIAICLSDITRIIFNVD